MAEIKRRFKSNCKEISVEHNGTTYLIICGKHINGGFCAFPKMNIAMELSSYDGDYGYNEKKLHLAFTDKEEYLDNDTETVCALAHIITDIIRELPDVLPF